MEAFLNFFEQMPAWQKLIWIISCLSFNLIIEGLIPLFKFDYKRLTHIGVNVFFLTLSMILNVLFGLATLQIFMWSATNEFGLLYLIDQPIWVEMLIAVLILDLVAQYCVHYALHKVTWMWRLHMIHHSDTHVDATTGTRHHPGDYIAREVFALFAIIIFGIPLAYYLFYRILTIFFAYFTHANISLPTMLDKTISFVFITPNMHKFHHHFERPWTDTNFGNIFSFWDRLLGTLAYENPKDIKYGLDVLDGRKDQDILYLLKVPFDLSIKTGREKLQSTIERE